jgi:hypothetical protein
MTPSRRTDSLVRPLHRRATDSQMALETVRTVQRDRRVRVAPTDNDTVMLDIGSARQLALLSPE